MGYQKNFDAWNEKKKLIHERRPPAHFKPGEVWWCSIGSNIGHEEDGKNEWFERPVCIIQRFGNELAWVVPLTTRPQNGVFSIQTMVNKTPNWAMVVHLDLLSARRLHRRLGNVSVATVIQIRDKIIDLLKTSPSLE